MDTSQKPNLEIYDECTDEHKVEEYYRIIPEETYSEDCNHIFEDCFYEEDFLEKMEKMEISKPIPLNETLIFHATIDSLGEIPELICELNNSKHRKFVINVVEDCYDKFIKAVRSKIPDLRINISKDATGNYVFKMEL